MHASVTMYNVTAVFVHFIFEFSQAVRSVILYTVANVFSVRNVIQAACKYMDNCIYIYMFTEQTESNATEVMDAYTSGSKYRFITMDSVWIFCTVLSLSVI